MMRHFLAAALLVPLMVAVPARANDGFGGLSATGLMFGQTDAVAMEEEDLFIGLDRVAVDYVFRNRTAQDVTGEVIFPLPPISIGAQLQSDWNLPDDRGRDNLVNFSVSVDGAPVAFAIDRQAVIEAPWEEGRPVSADYDAPGRVVTDDLIRLGLPLTVDADVALRAVLALDATARAEAAALGLVEYYPSPAQPEDAYPAWSIVLRHHWTQTFPAGAAVRVSHRYDHHPGGGIFVWQDPPRDDWVREVEARYCVDKSTSRGIAKRLAGGSSGDGRFVGMSWNIAYVLRTANSWAGPIGRFRLTLDKGSDRHIISLCAEGIEKTGPTTFVLEKRDYVPDRDLEVLIVAPMDN